MKQYVPLLIACMILLSGCWDKRMLKDHSLVLAIGYDLNEDGTISKTITFPQERLNNASSGEDSQEGTTEILTMTGNTVGDADIKLEQIISQKFDRSKSRVLLIGESLAKNGIFLTLDSMYRDPRGPLSSSIVIVSDRAESGLNIENRQGFLVSEFYFDLLKSAEESGVVKRENIQSICPVLLSGKKDIVLPFLKVDKERSAVEIEGLALFEGDKMVGNLTKNQAIMLLILLDEITKKIKLNFKIDDDEKREKNYVTFAIRKEKRKFNVVEEKGQVKVNIKLDLRIEIEELPSNHLYKEQKIQNLEEKITEQLTVLAKETIEMIQKVNNDALGIGEKVKAHYYSYWKEITWREVYPEIPIDVEFDVEIVQHGIIN